MILLTSGHLVEALSPLLRTGLCSKDISRLIGQGAIQPFGFLGRIPVFTLRQIGEIALMLTKKRTRRPKTVATGRRGRACKL